MASAARAHTATLECASCTLRLAGSALVPRSRKNRAAPRGLSQDRHQRVRFGSKHVTPTRVGAAPRVQHSHVKVVNSDAARRWPRPSATQRGCYAMATEDKSICVTGATGFVGKRLVQMLVERGYRVKVLTRDVNRAKALVQSNKKGALSYAGVSDWDRAVRGSYGVVNLAGEPISTRWTETIKREIMDSRVKATRKIVEAIAACPAHERPQVFVSSSAVGYYGTSMNNRYTETSQPGNDYLAEVCKRWEATALSLNGVADDVRIVIVRIGVVLDQDGGALAKMLPIFQMFAGGALGSGKQWFSWVHRDDLCRLILKALTAEEMEGAYNGTAPTPVLMEELCNELGEVMGRPSWLPVPDFALKAALGEGATVVLDGQQVVPERTLNSGFSYRYARLRDALRDIVA